MNIGNRQPSAYELISQVNKEVEIERRAKQLAWGDVDNHGYFKWVRDNWTSRGEPLDFREHAYLVDIYKDQHWFIAFMKSAQTGGTERVVTEALWLPDQFAENAVYVFPTGGSVGDLVQERVDEPLGNKDYLRMVSGRSKGLANIKHTDKVGLKRMSRGFVYFRGSGSPTQITSVPADMIIADEVDRMPPENIPYIPKRLEHSKRRWERWLSTPTIPNFGIHKIFLTTDMRYYNIKCNHCNHIQILDFWQNIIHEMKNEKEVDWAKLVCSKCKKELVPWHCEGEWIPTQDSDKHGYHISKLYSPRLDVKKIVQASLQTSEWELQQFYNQDLGVPYEPKGGKITDAVLQSCKRDYVLGDKTGVNFMGIDVGLKLHVIIQNEAGRIVLIKSVDDFDELDPFMDEYNVKLAVIDAMPETRKSQEFCKKYKGRAFMCYYSMKTVTNEEWFKTDLEDDIVVHTNRTISLDMYTNRYTKQTIELPKNLDDLLEFKDHMQALTRATVEKAKGEKVVEYLQTGPDHFYHAGNYSNLAKEMFQFEDEPDVFVL